MKVFKTIFIAIILATMIACSSSAEDITSSATGEVITNLTARATGGGAPFDGTVDTAADLDDLLETAWGDGSLDLHRGHMPVESVLVAFLGISHDEMHILMEEAGMNLAEVCEYFGFDPENLIDTLTASFVPFLEEGVENGVIAADELDEWTGKVRTEFSNRVYWEG